MGKVEQSRFLIDLKRLDDLVQASKISSILKRLWQRSKASYFPSAALNGQKNHLNYSDIRLVLNQKEGLPTALKDLYKSDTISTNE